MAKQTYEEAVIKTAMWWVEKIQQPLNQNNGDNSETGILTFIFANTLAMNAQDKLTDDKLKKFEAILIRRLSEIRPPVWLSVDYHPDKLLAECAIAADIDLSVFPSKTNLNINKNNIVIASYGYGADFVEI